MTRIKQLIVLGGLQNLWQVGLIFPLNLFATIYFILKARFKIYTSLDLMFALYLFAGIISLFTGFVISFVESGDPEMLLNSLKSFLVFLGVIVFFGAHELSIDELFKVLVWFVTLVCIALLGNYGYIFLFDPISFYQSRGAILWLPGWPQRWVMFPLIVHFVYLCRYDSTRSLMDLSMSLMMLTLILLSGTRSAFIGVIAGHAFLTVLSKRDLFRSLFVLALAGLVVSIFFDEFSEVFRFQEVQEFSRSDEGGSLSNRLNNLWPGIVDSLEVARIPFGWGHAGLAYIPHHFFPDTSQLSNLPGEQAGSAESQYMDVLLRQGSIGLLFLLAILVYGVFYAYKVYKYETDPDSRALWKASIAWQIAIILHGISVETLRFPIYSLFFFLFLGILSREYHRLSTLRKNKLGIAVGVK